MTNKKFIEALSKFPEDMEVVITDGWEARCYYGDFELKEFEGTIDIGIGGMRFYDDLPYKKPNGK